MVEAGELIPGDGTVIEGIASVDESAITGESAPVIRESGGDRSAVTGGTRVLSDRIVVEITQEPGQSFLDRMIALVEGAERRKTPNEIALNILLAGLTLIFMIVVATLRPFGAVRRHLDLGHDADLAARRADPDDDRRAAVARSASPAWTGSCAATCSPSPGRAVEASGDVDVLLLDKTGTITLGNRQASEFIPMPGVSEAELAEVAQLSSLADETPEGRSIVVLAKQYGIREHDMSELHAALRPVHRPDAHERRQPRRHPAAQGRRRRDHQLRRRRGRPAAAPSSSRALDRIGARGRHAAGRRPRLAR